jgi:hypothetical protein
MSTPSQRNRAFILPVLQKYLGDCKRCTLFEVGSGALEHLIFFAAHLPLVQFQCSESNLEGCNRLNGLLKGIPQEELSNLNRSALYYAGGKNQMPTSLDAVYLSNVLHFCDVNAAQQIVTDAGSSLVENGYLFCYGPFKQNFQFVSDSDERFNNEYLAGLGGGKGLRNVEDVIIWAKDCGLNLIESVSMPKNNLTLVFRKQQTSV